MSKRKFRRWTPEELAFLRQNIGRGTTFLATKLTGRSPNAIRIKARELGLVPARRHWTSSKIAKLRKLFPVAPLPELLKAFPDETRLTLQEMAAYSGLKRPERPYTLTGVTLVDQIRSRAKALRYTMRHLDEEVGDTHFFNKAQWLNGLNHQVIASAVEVLGGNIIAVWDD